MTWKGVLRKLMRDVGNIESRACRSLSMHGLETRPKLAKSSQSDRDSACNVYNLSQLVSDECPGNLPHCSTVLQYQSLVLLLCRTGTTVLVAYTASVHSGRVCCFVCQTPAHLVRAQQGEPFKLLHKSSPITQRALTGKSFSSSKSESSDLPINHYYHATIDPPYSWSTRDLRVVY